MEINAFNNVSFYAPKTNKNQIKKKT